MREHRQMKARQNGKIKEIGDALRATGYVTIDSQAKVLGLSRSTAWTLLRADHKTSGLSSAIVDRRWPHRIFLRQSEKFFNILRKNLPALRPLSQTTTPVS